MPEDKKFWTRTKITLAVIVAALVLFVWGCGPETFCLVQGGEPVQNALGMEWCELDDNPLPSGDDFSLNW